MANSKNINTTNIDDIKGDLVSILEGKIPEDKIKDIIMRVAKHAELQDHGDSPYTKASFAKVFLLFFFIISVILWAIIPIKNILTANLGTKVIIQDLEKDRDTPIGEKFAYNVEIEELLDGHKVISLYDYRGLKLLGKADIINNKAYIVSSKKDEYKIPSREVKILKTTKNALSENIKEDIYDLISNNISPNDEFLEFESIDFGVDQVINLNK